MTRRMRRSLCSMFAALAVMVVGAALAWACTPQAIIHLSPFSTTEAGSTITVTGEGFIPRPVEIRIDSGKPIATATGPKFSVPVRIPAAKPGVYYVEAVAYKPDGSTAGVASRPLRVKAAAPVSPVRTKEPAPVRERTQLTPKQPAVDDQRGAPVEAPAPVVAAPAPARAEPVTAVAEAEARRPEAATRSAAARAVPEPQELSPSVPPGPKVWSASAPTAPSLAVAPTTTEIGATAVVGLVLIALGLAGLGGAGYTLVRARARPPAPEADRDTLAMPESETRVVSIEDELEELIAASAARRAEPETPGSEPAPPRETLDTLS